MRHWSAAPNSGAAATRPNETACKRRSACCGPRAECRPRRCRCALPPASPWCSRRSAACGRNRRRRTTRSDCRLPLRRLTDGRSPRSCAIRRDRSPDAPARPARPAQCILPPTLVRLIAAPCRAADRRHPPGGFRSRIPPCPAGSCVPCERRPWRQDSRLAVRKVRLRRLRADEPRNIPHRRWPARPGAGRAVCRSAGRYRRDSSAAASRISGAPCWTSPAAASSGWSPSDRRDGRS